MSTRGIIFRTVNQCVDVAVAEERSGFYGLNLMHWDRRCQDGLKYSSDVKQQPNIKALGQYCLLFAKPGEIFNLPWCWENREVKLLL